jgi:hypothetical protein
MNLLTVPEVAGGEWLKCSERFVLDELRRKNLRGSKVAGSWRVSEADLLLYIEAHANVRPVRRVAS